MHTFKELLKIPLKSDIKKITEVFKNSIHAMNFSIFLKICHAFLAAKYI